jgi:hypothetical protein
MAVEEAGLFVTHVDVLFQGIDQVERGLAQCHDTMGLSYTKEPKLLVKKIVNFFSLLSQSQIGLGSGDGAMSDSLSRRTSVNASAGAEYGTITQELLALVTSLAQYFKSLIRLALSGAIKLERRYHKETAIGDFLNCVVRVAVPNDAPEEALNALKNETRQKLAETDVKSDLCVVCRRSVEDGCIRYEQSMRWHLACFKCHVTRDDLAGQLDRARFDPAEGKVVSAHLAPAGSNANFVQVTVLEQYTFLLRVALKRLYGLLKIQGKPTSISDEMIHSCVTRRFGDETHAEIQHVVAAWKCRCFGDICYGR